MDQNVKRKPAPTPYGLPDFVAAVVRELQPEYATHRQLLGSPQRADDAIRVRLEFACNSSHRNLQAVRDLIGHVADGVILRLRTNYELDADEREVDYG